MPSSSQGLNAFKSLNVPAIDGFGTPLNVNDIIASKSIYISGPFNGYYAIYGSHDGVRFAPIAIFRSDGNAVVKETKIVIGTYQQLLVFRRAFGDSPTISLSSNSTCSC